jgi:ferredoxin/flavodoxin
MMKGIILYFSLTGNTKLACEYIKHNVEHVDFELYNMRDGYPELNRYGLVGFATFASEFKVARFVNSYIDGIPKHKGKPAFVFTTYGQQNGAATKVLADSVIKRGFQVVSEGSLNTPENYPPVTKTSHGHNDNPTPEQMAEFNAFIERVSDISERLSKGERVHDYKVTAKTRYIIQSRIIPWFLMRGIMGKKSVDKDLCVKCKKCVAQCPYGAVKMEALPVFNESKCHGCFACYNVCPKKAIYTKHFKQFANYPKPIPQLISKLDVKH